MYNPPDATYDFAREHQYYDTLRQHFSADECLFVPCLSAFLSGYVTFNADAQRLQGAMQHVRFPEYEARFFTDGAVLWVTDASRERAEGLQRISGCKVIFVHNDPPSAQREQAVPADHPR